MEIIYRSSGLRDMPEIKKLLSRESSDDRNIENNEFLLAIDGGKIIGCIRIKELGKNVFELSSLVVEENYRLRGIGGKLVSKILKKDKRRPIYLLTQRDLEKFYSKNNFKLVDPQKMPRILYEEYNRVIKLPFARELKVISMVIF